MYAIPYYYSPAEEEEPSDNQSAEPPADEYRGGPTIFDRRGPGTYQPPAEDRIFPGGRKPAGATPGVRRFGCRLRNPRRTSRRLVLVFKDGHQMEVQNYAIVGSTLYDLTPGRNHKIAPDDLDLAATAKQNDDRGIDFEMPAAHTDN